MSCFFDLPFIWPDLKDSSKKIAFYYKAKNYEVDKAIWKNPPRIAKTKLLQVQVGIGVMKNNFIFHVMEETFSKLVQSGIVQYYEKFISEVVLRAEINDEKIIKPFGVEDLKFGFVIFLISCNFAIFVFFFEIFWHSIQNFIGLVGFLRGI